MKIPFFRVSVTIEPVRTLLTVCYHELFENMEFFYFCQEKDHGCVFFYLFTFLLLIFSRIDRIDQVVLEYCERAHSRILVPLLSDQRDWRATRQHLN
jgi:hypothetical protein